MDPVGLAWATSIFFKTRSGVPKFAETFHLYLRWVVSSLVALIVHLTLVSCSSREDTQTARALVVVLEILKQMLRLQTGFAVFVDDFYG
jgi:hypothetical protein